MFVIDELELEYSFEKISANGFSEKQMEDVVEKVGCHLPGNLYIVGFSFSSEVMTGDNINFIEKELIHYHTLLENCGEVIEGNFLILFKNILTTKAVMLGSDESTTKPVKNLISINDPTIVRSVFLKYNKVFCVESEKLETYSQIDNAEITFMVV